ncbi:MAG: hypothetical protein M5R42_20140 [Rhodocyclaceae bacterium]|nr:hypothetical protein [Rhodocyclaceae bacterium]
MPEPVRHVWNRMNRIALEFMLERYPDPALHLILAGEASLDATWPLTAPGVPSIRMLHNHFIVFDKDDLAAAAPADPDNPNLTDGGQHSLFQAHMRDAYRAFFAGLDLELLAPCERGECRLALTGYPQGLPSWEVKGGAAGLGEVRFWHEYDMLLKGFLDFYRTFFSQVSTRNAPMLPDLYFPALVEERLLFDNDFLRTAKMVRERCIKDARYANAIRWQPAFKQLIYRNDVGQLIVTISQNSIGNAITELLGVVVRRVPDADPMRAPSRNCSNSCSNCAGASSKPTWARASPRRSGRRSSSLPCGACNAGHKPLHSRCRGSRRSIVIPIAGLRRLWRGHGMENRHGNESNASPHAACRGAVLPDAVGLRGDGQARRPMCAYGHEHVIVVPPPAARRGRACRAASWPCLDRRLLGLERQ